MKLTEELLYNAITLLHVNKVGWEMKKDLNGLFAEKNLTVDKMLNMNVSDFLNTNANEVMSSDQTWFGKEFVQEVVLSSELIERLQANGSILAKAIVKQMNNKWMRIPVRGSKVRMKLSRINDDAPTGWAKDTKQIKKAWTAEITLNSETMTITIYYKDEWLEDSVINVWEYVLNAIADSYDTSIHQVLVNGDTATGNLVNINIIDWDTADLPDWDDSDIFLADWIRKTAIGKMTTVWAGWNLSIENVRSARAKMWVKWLNPANLALIPDTQTYFDLMNLTEVMTMEKFWDSATIKNGVLTAIDWIEIIYREELTLATATWEISATPANNVKGQIAIVHCPSIYVWIRKGLTTELSRYAEDLKTWVTWSARIAITLDDTQNNAEATSPCALIVNI